MDASILSAKDRNFEEQISLCLLRNQFLKSRTIEGELFFHVEPGSGIGFVASRGISDSVCLAVMARAYILQQEEMQARRTTANFRHRDDIFLVAEGGNGNLGTLSKH